MTLSNSHKLIAYDFWSLESFGQIMQVFDQSRLGAKCLFIFFSE